MILRITLLVGLLLLLGCSISAFEIKVPWCPVSDSAKARADSIPFVCKDSLFKGIPSLTARRS